MQADSFHNPTLPELRSSVLESGGKLARFCVICQQSRPVVGWRAERCGTANAISRRARIARRGPGFRFWTFQKPTSPLSRLVPAFAGTTERSWQQKD